MVPRIFPTNLVESRKTGYKLVDFTANHLTMPYSMPWHGATHLKRAIQGSKSNAPPGASLSKQAPVTLAHLHTLHSSLDLNNTFDTAVFMMATVAFWCQCRLAEVVSITLQSHITHLL